MPVKSKSRLPAVTSTSKVGRPKGYNKAEMLTRMEQRALQAIENGRIRHPLMIMLDYMDSLDKADNLEGAAKFAKELMPYFMSRIAQTQPVQNSSPTTVTINRFDGGESETITVGRNSNQLPFYEGEQAEQEVDPSYDELPDC